MTERSGRVRPIRPREVDKAKNVPDEVLEAFNELIAQNYYRGRANIKQSDVVALILQKGGERFGRQEIYDKHWLDVEEIYRAAGWKVDYDRPGYNETYEANFTFITPR